MPKTLTPMMEKHKAYQEAIDKQLASLKGMARMRLMEKALTIERLFNMALQELVMLNNVQMEKDRRINALQEEIIEKQQLLMTAHGINYKGTETKH